MDTITNLELPTFDLSVVIAHLRCNNPSMDEKYLSMLEREYRRYLYLRRMFPKQIMAPSTEMDDLWHEHIMHTKLYAEHCNQYFGYFLHHTPSLGSNKNIEAAWNATKDAYRLCFGTELPSVKSGICSDEGGGPVEPGPDDCA